MNISKWNASFKRCVAGLLALVMVFSMIPITALSSGIDETENSSWSGRSAVFVGDSITAGTGTTKIYYEYLKDSLGFGSVTAMGVGGSCFSAASDYGQSNQPLINRWENIPQADLIVVFMGTNDYGHETPLGTAEDTQDGTFYGTLNVIIPALVAKHTSSKIVFVTPLHRYGFGTSKILETKFTYDHIPNGVGATLGDYVQALKTVCADNGVDIIDLYTECTLDPTDTAVRSAYMPDGLHPNAAGHEVIAGIMASHIRGYKPVEKEPVYLSEMIQGNKFASGNDQPCRASSRVNYYLKAGTVITLKDPEAMQWACARTSNEFSSNNLGYFPDKQWTDKITAVVEEEGWIGFTFKYRDETKAFDLTKPLSDYITIEQPHTHAYEKGICTGCGAEDPEYVDFTGKTISILGASTATYAGVSNNTSDNSTIGKNEVYYTEGKHGVYLKDTWWQQVIDALGMRLLVNNSWSGSCVFMQRRGEASVGYGDRAINLHNDHTGEEPDVILVYIGGNDFAYYKDTFGKAASVDYSALIKENGDGTFSYETPQTTCDAYAIMLHKIENRYPNAQIYCMTSAARRDPDYPDNYPDAGQPTEYNAELQKVAEYFGFPVIDLENAIAKEAEIFDKYMGDKRAHPNALGMDQFTNEVLSVLLGKEAEIRHVISEDNTVKEQAVLLGGSYSAEVNIPEGYTLSVIMDGKDITEDAYSKGKIFVGEVTGNIEVSAKRGPQIFRWELSEDAFVSVTTGSNTENPLTMDGGTISDGAFSNVRGSLEKSVYLYHDRPWVLEWSCTGDYNATLFTSTNNSATVGMRYLFRANNASGLIAFGEYDGSQHNNYGVVLSEYDIDMSEEHIYRLENRIAQDGTNMAYLLVDGVELGAMNHYYIGSTSDQGVTSNWLSGEDFVFDYIGSSGRPINNCSIGYLQVWENGEPAETLALRYDDHYDVTGKTVEILDAGKPTSYKVGYGVAEGTLDDAVVTLEGNTLIATGIGTALVRIDGQLYEVTVTAAPISLFMITGHSMGAGQAGTASQSVLCEEGQVYSSHGVSNLATETAGVGISYAAGKKANNVNAFTSSGSGTIGEGSALGYSWNKLTGEKAWILNTAVGGSCLPEWIEGKTNYKNAVKQFQRAQKILQNEIYAGHYTLSHMGILYHNGANFSYKGYSYTPEELQAWYDSMWSGFKRDLTADMDGDGIGETVSFLGLIPIWTASGGQEYTQDEPAGLYMAASEAYPDVFLASTIGSQWLSNDSVATNFPEMDYPVHSGTLSKPSTTAEVFASDRVHYKQAAYNAVGADIANNLAAYLYNEAGDVSVKISLTDDFADIAETVAVSDGQDLMLVPHVMPIWCNDLCFEVSGNIMMTYPMVISATGNGEGTLTISRDGVILKTVSFMAACEKEKLSLLYDDRYDVTGKTVQILDAGTPTSYKVGYGVAEGTLDDAVVTLQGNTLIATGIGIAKVKIDGQIYEVTVEKAKLNIVVIMGQSNAGNHFANATSDITCPPGTAYWWGNGQGTAATEPVAYTQPSMGFHTPLLAELYAQSVAAGDPVKNVLVWQEGITSKNGQSIVKWAASADDTSGTDATVTMIENCLAYYAQHPDKYEIVGKCVYWLQGESDTEMDPDLYTQRFMAMWGRLKAAGMEKLAFLRVRRGTTQNQEDHQDLYHSASLSAQIHMVNENPDMFLATTLTENWVGTADTVHTVDISQYITLMQTYGGSASHTDSYGNDATYADGKLTTTMKSLYGSNNKCHYGKFGYALIGADAAYNMYRALHGDLVEFVIADTSGHVGSEHQHILLPGGEVTVDITDMEEDLTFRAGCGTVAGTMSFKILSGQEDISDREGLILASGQHYGAVSVDGLKDFEDVSITVTYTTAEGTAHSVVCNIYCEAQPLQENYIWDFNEDLKARDEEGNVLNSFLEAPLNGSYTLENGYLIGTALQLQLEKLIRLEADKNWSVEWKYGSLENGVAGFLLCEDPTNTVGNRAIYHVNTGRLMISDYADSSGYRNYTSSAVTVSDNDCLRITNSYDPDTGKSTMSLWQNGKLVIEDFQLKGSINKGDDSMDMTVYPLNGEFEFRYLGNRGISTWLVSCELDYLKIAFGEVPEFTSEVLSLRFDDHYDVTGKTVEIVDAGTPTSYKVGYGVEEGTLDDAVVTLEGDTLIATGIGTAKVRIDDVLYEVTVTAAPISLLLLIGQSNMRGSEGDANQSIVCPDGMVYATFGDDRGDAAGIMNVNNATKFAASALTGPYSTVNVEGTTEHLSFYPINSLTEAGAGTFGPDSGFAYEWVKQTGEKVWVVNAAHGGSSITSWQPGAVNYRECVLLFNACQETLRKEIAAGHFTLSHMGYFWCQGCADRTQTAQWYVEKYLAMHESLKTALAFDHDGDSTTADKSFEFAGIIPVRVGNTVTCYRDGTYSVSNPYAYHESFVDLRFSGPRVAQYWMINNPDLPDIWGVCDIGEDWVWMPDGTNGVTEYFQDHYPGGTVDYTTQVAQKTSWYTPTTPKAVHDSVHYNQIGYNEIGREAARNALIMLGEIEASQVETTVKFLSWDGYTEVNEIKASATGNSAALVVPKVYPVWKSKEVSYTLSDGLSWEYYDLLAANPETIGALESGGKAVIVVKADPYTQFIDHLAELPDAVCGSLNLWNVLEHDEYYYANGTGWGIYSSGTVPSVTFFVNPGDRIYATSFGAAGTNGHATADGIRVTFFGEYDVVKTMSPAQTYAEFSANGGWLVVPEGAVAINIPMRSNSDENEIYILNREHAYNAVVTIPTCKTDGYTTHTCICGESYTDSYVASTGEHGYTSVVTQPTCGEQGYTTHTCAGCGNSYIDSYVDPTGEHSFGDWTATKLPAADSLGEDKRVCAGCGLTESRGVEGVWQIYDLAAHLLELPEHVCCDTNLWSILPHEDIHFTSGKKWGVTGTPTTSITIPVNPGDRIYATSWNKAGENGHESSDGIRLTFFDAYGIALTLGPGESYRRFAANGGYLEAPEGTIAINIVMWYDSEDYEVYILNREHDYQGTTCTVCGAEHPEAANYSGKVISILGDSISTFAGYIPVADGFNLTHRARYPQSNLLKDVNETWWMQVITQLDAKLGINDSWAGSRVINTMKGNSGDQGEKAAIASLTRIQNLGSNGTPDVILFYGGTNDIGHLMTLGSFDPETAPTQVDLVSTKWESVADAYVAAILRLRYYYPDAQIIAMLPTYTTSYYTDAELAQYNEVFASICAHYGVTYVDLRYCGISTAELPDGIHPDAAGMDYISDAVLETMLSAGEMEAGEHIVYSVTHELDGVEASLGYYKGVSVGKPFVETVSGENLTVTVTMGGTDITESCYSDGVISVFQVTGDIVIRAKGEKTSVHAAHLQQLPEAVCAGTNLWTALQPENLYYTTSGWGIDATGKVHSVTIPIHPGDRLWATSFQASGTNGGGGNGIRITWFDEYNVIKSMSPNQTYAEFSSNGYLTAPEGAAAVNVVMWNGSDSNAFYILNRQHIPGEAVKENETADGSHELAVYCEICGKELSREAVAGHIPGDITGDGEVNNKDLTRLFKYLTGYDVEVVEAALDVNGDGSVNNKDQTRLFRYLSGWDVEIY